MELKVIFTAVKQLVSPTNEAATQKIPDGSILQKLSGSLKSYHGWLKENDHLLERVEYFRPTLSCSPIIFPKSEKQTEQIYLEFTVEGLCLLLVLDDTLLMLHKEDKKTIQHSTKPAHAPLAPKAILSVSEQKLIPSLIQFIALLGIYPYLLPGVDNLLKAKYTSTKTIAKIEPLASQTLCLCKCCQVLSRCFDNPILGPVLLPLFLSDVLAGLLQICYDPTTWKNVEDTSRLNSSKKDSSTSENTNSTESKATSQLLLTPADISVGGTNRERAENVRMSAIERDVCLEKLQRLLTNAYQPLVVRELLALQSLSVKATGLSERQRGTGLRWLQKACGELLSERLMHKNGVQNVLKGILEATNSSGVEGGSDHDWKKCQSIARIITSCPSQAASVEDYYCRICPQVLDVLHLPMEGVGRLFVRVIVATISRMMTQQRELALKYLFQPLIKPLRGLCGDVAMGSEEQEKLGKELHWCIADLHKICGVVEPSSPFSIALQPYLVLLFEIWSIGYNHSIATCSLSKDLLSKLLSLGESLVVELLQTVSGVTLLSDRQYFKTLHPSLALKIADGENEPSLMVHQRNVSEVNTHDVDEMERIGNCVLEMLKSNADIASVVSVFFLQCLEHISKELCKTTNYKSGNAVNESQQAAAGSEENTGTKSSSLLLHFEQSIDHSQEEAYSSALVLYITAALCEQMSDDVLKQLELPVLLSTISTIVGCHAQFAERLLNGQDQTSILQITGPSLENLLGGPITLSIAFGLLSAILGGAREVQKSDRPLFMAMLPSLEALASNYPDVELSSLADDLRICIVTLGAVWTTEMNEKAAELKPGGGLTEKVKVITTTSGQTKHHGAGDDEGSRSCPEKGDPTLKGANVVAASSTRLSDSTSQDLSKSGSLEQTAFQQALQDLKDPLLPVRGHGLIALKQLIERKDTVTLSNSAMLLNIFKEHINHSDPYIYLAALNGLVALSSSSPANLSKIIAMLCEEYAQLNGPPSREGVLSMDGETGQLKQEVTHPLKGHGGTSEAAKQHSVEFRMKLGEALVKVARDCNELLPHYLDLIMASVLSNVRDLDPLVRASSVSNLADVCAIVKFSFGQIQHEVLSCVTTILQTDKEVKVRQAALVVIKLLIKNLSHNTVKVLGESLLEIYRLLKYMESNEKDDLTRAHAQAALGELDIVMRAFIFPEHSRYLTKKISILDNL